jgi:hypothetical protein
MRTVTTILFHRKGRQHRDQVSISPTLQAISCSILLHETFGILFLGFVIFWLKETDWKAGPKMFVKLVKRTRHKIIEI